MNGAFVVDAATRKTEFLRLGICLLLATGLAVWLGQDANWDLRNYHFYNAYAFVEGRAAVDLAPAQMQSFHSPYADLPYYAMTRAGWPTWLIAALLAIPAGIALHLLHRLAARLLPGGSPAALPWLVVAIGATGAAGAPVVGTTMSEWHLVALLIGALLLIMPREIGLVVGGRGLSDARTVGLAGLLAGIACGLKLTAFPAFVALIAALVVLAPGTRAVFSRVLAFGIAGLVGFVVAYGAWGWSLWHQYQNPFFPYFNDVFASPWAERLRFADDKFAVRSAFDFIALPFRLMAKTAWLVSEAALRDWRLALGGCALAWLAFGPASAGNPNRLQWRALAAFASVDYAIWAVGSGIYRYVGVLEAIASLALVAWVWLSFPRRRAVALSVLAFILAVSTKWPGWERAPHGPPLTQVEFPAIAPDTMVLLATMQPIGYAVTSLPPAVPVVSVVNNLLRDSAKPAALHRKAIERAQGHAGPLRLLRRTDARDEKSADGKPISGLLASWGISIDEQDCQPVRARWHEDRLELCALGHGTKADAPAR